MEGRDKNRFVTCFNMQMTPSIHFDTHISGLSSINHAFDVEFVLVRLPCAGVSDIIKDNTRETV